MFYTVASGISIILTINLLVSMQNSIVLLSCIFETSVQREHLIWQDQAVLLLMCFDRDNSWTLAVWKNDCQGGGKVNVNL